MASVLNSPCLECPASVTNVRTVDNDGKVLSSSDEVMSHTEEEEPKPKENWTENDLKEAIRRINAGEINFKDAENMYGISPRTIHRQRAIENMRAQLNPEKAKKLKSANNSAPKKDVTILRKPLEISCSTLGDVVGLLNTGTEEVKRLLNHECDLIYECKVCKNLFRSLVNFISHKRIYCCDLYSAIHMRTDENDDESEIVDEDRLKEKENIKEFTAKPFRVTCKKDLTAVLKRITTMAELFPTEPILHLQTLDTTPCAFQQVLFTNEDDIVPPKPICEPKETKETAVTVEVEKDKPVSLPKSHEKSSHSEKHFVAEKRFRCPVCLSNFTIKRSVLRHLKSVHHKSVEQVEKLKSRIQVHFVRIKNNSSETNKEKQEDHNSSGSIAKTSEQKDGNWEKECGTCGSSFTNKSTYLTHLKNCKRNSNDGSTSNETSPKKTISLVPVISLTPIVASSYTSKSEIEDNPTEPASNLVKKTTSSNQSSKKIALPLTTSSNSQSKKIGIQVRMNYCKDTTSAPNSASVTPTSYATSSVASSQSSEDNSRRNSILSIIGCEDMPRIESTVSHNTRSGSKLANILENLCDKRNRNEKAGAVENEVIKKSDKSNVTIYCNSCRKVYSLNDFNCGVIQQNIVRHHKCAIRDCDFSSADINKLIPHLSEKHLTLPENELTSMKSIFVAEFLDENGLSSLGDCKRRPVHYEKSEDTRLKKKPANDRCTTSNDPSSSSGERIPSGVSHSSSSKRKLPCNTKTNVAKRKTANDKESINNDTSKVNDIKIKNEETPDMSKNIFNIAAIRNIEDIKIENSDDNDFLNNDSHNAKKSKKTRKDDDKNSQPKKKKNISDSSSSTVLNGGFVSNSSSDEENEKTQVNPKLKVYHSRNIRKPNVPPIDPKLWKSPQKLNLSSLFNDLSPSSSTPDSDLDQSMMSDENLKKSIMTIIFGKDMSAEKVEESVSNREKSPSSSSSSDCGKEKRYSFRIAKQGPQVKSAENKEEKLLKPPCLNKAKPSSR